MQVKLELHVKKVALCTKLKEVQEVNIVCEPKSLTKRLKTPSWRSVMEEGWHNVMKVQCPVLARMSPSAFEQIMLGPQHQSPTTSGKMVVCGDSRQICMDGGVLHEVALEPMQSRRPLQDLVTNKLGTRSVQHKVVVVDVGTNNLVSKKASGQAIDTQDFSKTEIGYTEPLHTLDMLITQQVDN